ncbi:universal stress protein [Desulforhopalus vacuolatus]|uniref:universal stress protein n=1 Tax=Desulforhopalus vacuolatus TaxID=40414 RepID=UPI0019648568|nr:universal stress protein [Desulforhopalus vacuolatus]MBM9519667.1 universal stress protein [Desulforhopalus vacuolatus]
MAQIKNVMASLDMSGYADLVMDYIAELLKDRTDAEVVIYSVINQRDIDHIEDVRNYFVGLGNQGVTTQKYIDKETAARTEHMNMLGEKYLGSKGIKYSVKIATGHPAEMIIKKAKEGPFDLIVMANKGKSNIAKALFGSIALRVLRHSPVPVLSVRKFD